MFCAEWSLVKHDDPWTTIIPLRCHCWTCDDCRPGRVRRLVSEAKAGAPNLFVTLTSRYDPTGSREVAARRLVGAWRQVRREYLKAHGKRSLPFLAVFEATKRGWPHLHIICRARWLDQRWLSKRMGALIGAPIVDVRRVKGLGKVAAYVSKYVGKNPHRFAGVKRYWRSLDYLSPVADTDENKKDPRGTWEVVEMNWREYAVLLAPSWLHEIGHTHEIRVYQARAP